MSTRVRPPAPALTHQASPGRVGMSRETQPVLLQSHSTVNHGGPDKLLETLPPPTLYDLHAATAHQSANPDSVPLLSTFAVYSTFRNPQSTPLRFPAPLPLFIRAQNDRLPPSDLIACAIASSRPVW